MANNLQNFKRWAPPLLLFFGGFFILLAIQDGCYQKGVKLTAVVVAKEYSPGTSRFGTGSVSSPSRHMIRYRFTTPEGIVKEDRSEVLLQNWSKLREGDAVNIEYLPATGDSRITGQTSSAPVFLVIGAVLLAGGWFLRRRKSPRPSGEGS
jgi:LPXTG-motif cell wall-anchored protein